MDRVIRHKMSRGVKFAADKDLIICPSLGLAFQDGLKVTAKYDEEYFDKCADYEDTSIGRALNKGRVAFVARHVGQTAYVCDVGIGSGEFIRNRPRTHGLDVNQAAIRWLKEQSLWAYDLSVFLGFTFWDVIEHVPEPQAYLDCIGIGCWAFFSIPVFHDLSKIRDSRHYRPGEHLYYWTQDGFKRWLESYGFKLEEASTFESDAGRDSIHSFAFRREHARL